MGCGVGSGGSGATSTVREKHLVASFGGCWEDRGGRDASAGNNQQKKTF